jgi:hypothetical protein
MNRMAIRGSLSPVLSNIFMEHFKKLALDPMQYQPSLWLRYVDDTFMVWPGYRISSTTSVI